MAHTYDELKKVAEDKGLLPGCKANFIGATLGHHPEQPGLIMGMAKLHVKECEHCREAKQALRSC